MASSSKKMGVSAILKIVAAVVGLVGLVIMLYVNSLGSDYEFSSSGLLITGSVCGIVLAVLSAVTPLMSFDKHGWIGEICAAGSAFLLCYTAVQAVSGRIILISGLYSWNSSNEIGWTVFYYTIAVVACLAVAALIEVVATFLAPTKETADADAAAAVEAA